MKKPIIFAVDDDPQVLRAIVRDLKGKYRKNYRIISTDSAKEAIEVQKELRKKGEDVALMVSDQRMPEMLGVDYLEIAKGTFPDAKQVLLTAYSDTDAAIKAINDVSLDYYLMKPWDPPEEKMFPVLDDLLEEWQVSHKPAFKGLRLIGFPYSKQSHAIKDFLSGNLFPYKWVEAGNDPEYDSLMELHGLGQADLPAVVLEDGKTFKQPQPADIASVLGLNPKPASQLYDVVIIGAGPAGLGAAVYGGSEGLKTLLIEKRAPGGQAGTSSRIENYLGFPKGLSGSELSRRALAQATRFGIEFLSPQSVSGIQLKDQYKILTLADGTEIAAKSVVISTGVDYRKLSAEGIDKFTGAGVYYGAATTEARATMGKDVYIVGGGNSAGQGAMYLSRFAKNVYILIRKPSLKGSMSSYLIDQIAATDNIHVMGETQVTATSGEEHLTHISIDSMAGDDPRTVEAGALFVFIGAKPYTDWLRGMLLIDEKGFIATGRDLATFPQYQKVWKRDRSPFLLETCVPGIFAAGDVRMGAMARVASAVGEGAMAISFVHRYLREV